jgi:hypothetical protein
VLYYLNLIEHANVGYIDLIITAVPFITGYIGRRNYFLHDELTVQPKKAILQRI